MALEGTPRSKASFNLNADSAEAVRTAIDELLADDVIETLLRKGVDSGYDPGIRLPNGDVAKSPLLADRCREILSNSHGAYKAIKISEIFTHRGAAFYNMTFCRESAPEQKPLTGFRKWWDGISSTPRPTYIVP